MPFEPDGRLRMGSRNRPNQPLHLRVTQGMVLHHLIDWAVLRDFWNAMVTRRLAPSMTRYLGIIRFEHARPDHVVTELLAGNIGNFSLWDRDSLDQALCWQAYNLFEGPGSDFRPGHSPPPERMLEVFRNVGSTSFDFPIVAPPHGERAQTLWRAFQMMTEFNAAAGGTPQECLNLLQSVSHLEVIPAYDVNWFALRQPVFWRLSPIQRQQFFAACYQRGWGDHGDDVHAQLFAAAE